MSAREVKGSSNVIPKVVYHPKVKENQTMRFRSFVEQKYTVQLKDYWDLHKWSIEHYTEFWDSLWQFYDVKCSQPYTKVCNPNCTFLNVEWFIGARLNYTENILRYRDNHIAIIATDDEDRAEYVTYRQLYDEVHTYAHALRDCGIRKGDVVAGFMSNKKEAVFAYLATLSIGAMWGSSLPLLGTKAVLSRFQQIEPKVLFTAGDFNFENSTIRMTEKIAHIVEGLPSLEKVIYIPTKNTEAEAEIISKIPKCMSVSEFLAPSRKKLQDHPREMEFEQVPFGHPLSIEFTSGTTGLPKGLIHSCGIMMGHLKDYGLVQDITREDVILSFSTVGWVTWNMAVGVLQLGATLCMYEGFPFDASATRFYDVIDTYHITSSFLWSSTVENMETKGHLPTPTHSLKSLKQIICIGSSLKPHSFDFLAEKVKLGLFNAPGYGTTEACGFLSGSDSTLPVYRGEIQAPSLGIDLKVVNEKGEVVVGERGDAVISKPFVSNVVGVIHDLDKEALHNIYLKQHPGYWSIGDSASINPSTKGFVIYGRCDETLNPKGARFNCSEIYYALEGFPGLIDSVCVSQYNAALDERVVLFVQMSPGHPLTPEVERDIRRTIEDSLSVEHVPELVLEAPGVPYSMTGKKLNVLVKKLVNRVSVTNADVVVNPACLPFYRTLQLGEF